MRQGISGLTFDEWHFTIEGNGNNAAFLVWHSVRTEDNILRFILQKRPTIWMDGNWHERLTFHPECRVRACQQRKHGLCGLPTPRSSWSMSRRCCENLS